MRKKKECWLLDEDYLIHGYKDKYGFHPDKGIQCGFSYQILRRKEVNKVYFLSKEKGEEYLKKIGVI